MERRYFAKLVLGVAAGIAILAASAQAAPLPPISAEQNSVPPRAASAEPAVIGQDEVDRLKPEQVRWHHGYRHHHHWRHWHHHLWHRWHHWHHRHWHHHHWRHHHWHHRHR